ncbi:hypothetical protein M407DRAFT_19073 [Tulasnella calospora MUT 4182]|uniref:Importin subunit alpha n=1 Tax=Tulasnella calospora MUT 4182 TaxID=1051891 RepID=A0A0C3QSQ4_9AGAM|nr:hypothetical protein M407DRAFT_19073 [Tulasnella calospora MUT 4182]
MTKIGNAATSPWKWYLNAQPALHLPDKTSKTANVVMENASNISSKNESAEAHDQDRTFDESELDGYITVHKRIAPEIVNALRSNDRTARLGAATKLSRLLDKRESTAIQPIIDSGILSDIVKIISLEDVDLHVPLNAVLSWIVAGSDEQASAVVKEGAIQKFILLASSSSSNEARDDALLSLGNIGADSPLREKLIREGGLKPLLDVLGNPSKHQGSHMYHAAQALKITTYSLKPGSDGYEVTWDIIPTLTQYIEYQTDETAGSLEFSLLALSNILLAESTIDTTLQSNIVPRLVQLCTAEHAPTRQAALGCVGLILAGSNKGTNRLVDAGIIEAIRPCITSGDGGERSKACWAAANIAVGTYEQAKALMAAGFVPLLVKVVSDPEEDYKARGDAAWALASLVCDQGPGNHKILKTLLEATCLDGLLSALTLEERSVIQESLKGIMVFVQTLWKGKQRAIETLKAGGGVAVLRAFKLRPEPDLAPERLMAHTILKYHLEEFSLPPRV